MPKQGSFRFKLSLDFNPAVKYGPTMLSESVSFREVEKGSIEPGLYLEGYLDAAGTGSNLGAPWWQGPSNKLVFLVL